MTLPVKALHLRILEEKGYKENYKQVKKWIFAKAEKSKNNKELKIFIWPNEMAEFEDWSARNAMMRNYEFYPCDRIV